MFACDVISHKIFQTCLYDHVSEDKVEWLITDNISFGWSDESISHTEGTQPTTFTFLVTACCSDRFSLIAPDVLIKLWDLSLDSCVAPCHRSVNHRCNLLHIQVCFLWKYNKIQNVPTFIFLWWREWVKPLNQQNWAGGPYGDKTETTRCG